LLSLLGATQDPARSDPMPATSATFAPAANISPTILAFSSEDQWHRRLPLFKISTCISQ
jgi:hypothetical protein